MNTENKEEIEVRSTKKTPSDEIDLNEIFVILSRGFRAIGTAIKFFFNLIARMVILFVSFTVLGIGLGLAMCYTTKPFYTSSMTLVLADIRNDFVGSELDNLKEMVEENNFAAMAARLEVSEQSASAIKEMEFFNLDEERIAEDSVLTGSPFRIQLSLYDPALFPTMEAAITAYLEGNPYFAKQKRIRQQEVESLIKRLNLEIASIDSLKAETGSPRGPVNGFVYGEPLDPTNLFKESVAMYEQKVELEAELNQLDNIQVVSSFTPRSRPTGPNLLKYMLIGGAAFFVLAVIVALNLEARKRRKL